MDEFRLVRWKGQKQGHYDKKTSCNEFFLFVQAEAQHGLYWISGLNQ